MEGSWLWPGHCNLSCLGCLLCLLPRLPLAYSSLLPSLSCSAFPLSPTSAYLGLLGLCALVLGTSSLLAPPPLPPPFQKTSVTAKTPTTSRKLLQTWPSEELKHREILSYENIATIEDCLWKSGEHPHPPPGYHPKNDRKQQYQKTHRVPPAPPPSEDVSC